jgi:hypothetical protein
MRERVEFRLCGGRKLIERHVGSAARRCARLAPDWAGLAGEISDAVVSVFFPSGCRICERLLTSASRVPICEECLSSFERVPNIVCEICGLPLPGWTPKEGEALLCPACRNRTYAFDRARSFAVYQDAVVQAILLLKFEQIESLGRWFAERLAEVVKAEGDRLAADEVVPVPLHRARTGAGIQPSGVALQAPGKKAPIAPQSGAADAHAGATGQASAEFGGKMGVSAWRFCHTSRQPG